jgi:hypothetical protein
MNDIRVVTTLEPRDVMRVSLSLLVLHPVSIALMAAGPVLLASGALSGSEVIASLGQTMVWLVVLVPVWGLLAATYSSYRPGAASVYEPAEWSFTEDGADVSHPAGAAHAEWAEFTGWRSVADSLLLHTSPSHYVVIPWRDVPPGSRGDLERLLTEHIGLRRR